MGNKNGNYGTVFCVEVNAINCNNRKRFNKSNIPKGWITCAEWRDFRKNKLNSAYGRHWYNDGVKNYYLYPSDNKIVEMNLEKRRLHLNG